MRKKHTYFLNLPFASIISFLTLVKLVLTVALFFNNQNILIRTNFLLFQLWDQDIQNLWIIVKIQDFVVGGIFLPNIFTWQTSKLKIFKAVTDIYPGVFK